IGCPVQHIVKSGCGKHSLGLAARQVEHFDPAVYFVGARLESPAHAGEPVSARSPSYGTEEIPHPAQQLALLFAVALHQPDFLAGKGTPEKADLRSVRRHGGAATLVAQLARGAASD